MLSLVQTIVLTPPSIFKDLSLVRRTMIHAEILVRSKEVHNVSHDGANFRSTQSEQTDRRIKRLNNATERYDQTERSHRTIRQTERSDQTIERPNNQKEQSNNDEQTN